MTFLLLYVLISTALISSILLYARTRTTSKKQNRILSSTIILVLSGMMLFVEHLQYFGVLIVALFAVYTFYIYMITAIESLDEWEKSGVQVGKPVQRFLHWRRRRI